MAIANSDGSIILSTKVDTSGLNKGMSQMEVKAAGLTKTFSKLSAAIASAFAIQKIIQFNNESSSLATQTEASVQRLVDIYGSASDAVGDFIDQNARALGMSKAAASSFSSVYGNLFSAFADQETNAALTNEYLQMTAVVASKTGRTVEDVQERIRSGLLGNTEAIEDLGIFVNVKTIEMTDAFQRMAGGKSWEQLDAYTQQQIRAMAILEQSTAKYGDEVADTSATIRNRYKAAYEDFQNSWGNIVNTVLLPVLETLTKIFDIAKKGLNALSGRSEQILKNVELQEENTDKTAENIEEQTKNQKDLNKEMKKTLAGFDDIQILSANTAENTGNGGGNLGDLGLGDTAPDGSAYVEEINKTLTAIMAVVAVSMIAIGLILLFTGNIAWGIGTIIFGVALEGVTMAAALQTDFGQDIIQTILTIQAVASGALLAIGIILCFLLGPSPVTIGLIVAGGALLVGTVGALIGLNPSDIQTWLSIITGIAGGAMLALGIILCMVGSIPVGVGLIIAGVASLGFAVALNFDAVVEAIRGPIGIITAIVSGALLVLGIILICTGVGIPLGLGLILAGAAGLATVVAVNWNAIVDWVKGAWEATKEWLLIHGGLILGIILILSGVGAPFGWALLLDSVGSLGKGQKPALWSNVLDSIKTTWQSIKAYWNANISNVWTLKFWLGLAKTAGNGLIDGFEIAINGIIGMFEKMINWIVNGLNKISFDVPDWVPLIGGKNFGFNIPEVKFGKLSIPRLAQGAVIPPNREFLAVLGDQRQGTNIETPLSTMVEAFKMALDSRGGYNGGNTEVVLEIDGREFGRAVVEQGNRENRRIGTRLVIV